MTDLVCEECHWGEPSFDEATEIAEYMEKTELIETHFADQDCPKCGAEESTEIYYRTCIDCGEAEVDCTCNVETEELSEKEAEKFREEILDLVEKKLEEQNTEKERDRLRFKRRDLRRIAARLIQKHFTDAKEKNAEGDRE